MTLLGTVIQEILYHIFFLQNGAKNPRGKSWFLFRFCNNSSPLFQNMGITGLSGNLFFPISFMGLNDYITTYTTHCEMRVSWFQLQLK